MPTKPAGTSGQNGYTATVSSPESTSGLDFLSSLTVENAFDLVGSSDQGLTSAQAAARRSGKGGRSRGDAMGLVAFLNQFRSPTLLLLIFAAGLSGFLGDASDSVTILAILLVSSALSFYQERQAGTAVQRLLSLVESKANVLRDGRETECRPDEVVPGDVVVLAPGGSIPGDGLVLASQALLVNEASLTGESMPVEKSPRAGSLGVVLRGTHVQSGFGRMLVVKTGDETMYGSVAGAMQTARPEPQFHQGIRRYGHLLMEFTLLLTLAVFAVNVALHKPVIESFLFSLALAVGLTPQLLPAIMSITLARGARQMAKDKVIVKRLEAIEDFGSMDVLCSDKTGTLTLGTVRVASACDPAGVDSKEVLRLALINATGSRSSQNPIDDALRAIAPADLMGSLQVVSEVPYDFQRRRQSVLIEADGKRTLITKGAVASVLEVCEIASDDRAAVQKLFESLSSQGLRVLGVAQRNVDTVAEDLETGMAFAGLVSLEDPLRPDSAETVATLRKKGVRLKLITGDNQHVAAHIAGQIGLEATDLMTGEDAAHLSKAALARKVRTVDVFAEVDPIQKEHIILACRQAGYVVGYIGDGINDAPALHASDVGISVSGAVDVAREAADFVMLERGLAVISAGVDQGRQIFANTMKYVMITSSANFGNMFSMAAASLFLPFLPLLPKQILLNNFLTDIPAMTIAGDAVDAELVRRPRRWNVSRLRTFMIVFGLHSSVFDMLTFGALILLLKSSEPAFQTAWFVESALSELLILLVIRTRKPLFRSHPSPILAYVSATVALGIVLLPYLPFMSGLGFVPLPPLYCATLGGILGSYTLSAEWLKHAFMN